MSSMEDKLSIITAAANILGDKPRAYLKRHLTYKDGTPRYEVVLSDKYGPTRIKVIDRMNGRVRFWNRISTEGKDFLFEGEHDQERHEG